MHFSTSIDLGNHLVVRCPITLIQNCMKLPTNYYNNEDRQEINNYLIIILSTILRYYKDCLQGLKVKPIINHFPVMWKDLEKRLLLNDSCIRTFNNLQSRCDHPPLVLLLYQHMMTKIIKKFKYWMIKETTFDVRKL